LLPARCVEIFWLHEAAGIRFSSEKGCCAFNVVLKLFVFVATFSGARTCEGQRVDDVVTMAHFLASNKFL
jgi:hypothetical protein